MGQLTPPLTIFNPGPGNRETACSFLHQLKQPTLQMMLRIFLLSFVFFFALRATAQQYTTQDESDPRAKSALDKLRKKYEAFNTLEVRFSLEIEIPEQPTQTQKGQLLQQGNKYRLQLQDRTMVCDGKSVWLYLADHQEVQINNVEEEPEEGVFNSPKDLLAAYQWKNHVYYLTNEYVENGRLIQQIEFKPIARDADYSKVRLTLDKKSNDIVRIKTFNKDGSRFTLKVEKITGNKSLPPGTFTFSKSECPDCHWEDLRI